MKQTLSVFALCVLLLLTQSSQARLPASSETLPVIDELNLTIQDRLQQPLPNALGMSRIMGRSSFGEHFRPVISDKRDFSPETERERKVIAALEDRKVQVGLYLFGASILEQDAKQLSFRALKGPGALTAGTPRPRWYPATALLRLGAVVEPESDAGQQLPDWNAIYPVAQRAMRSFQDGGTGFEIEFQNWTVAARPAIAAQEKCVSCHNNPAYRRRHGVAEGGGARMEAKLGQPIGGVLYAFRIAN